MDPVPNPSEQIPQEPQPQAAQPPALSLFSELWKRSWNIYKSRAGTFIAIAFFPVFCLWVAGFLPRFNPFLGILSIPVAIAGWALYIVVTPAIIFSIRDGSGAGDSYSAGFKIFWPVLWVSVLSLLVVWGGFALLIVPGVIIAIQIMFSQYALILEDKRGLEALMRSAEYVRGYWGKVFWRVFLLGLVLVGAGIAIGIIFGILSAALGGARANIVQGIFSSAFQIFTIPFFAIFYYELFAELRTIKPELISAPVAEKRGKYIAFAIVGVIVPFVVLALFFMFLFPKLNRLPQYPPSAQSVSPWANVQNFAEWKTYRNTQYGFQIAYPSDWQIEQASDSIMIADQRLDRIVIAPSGKEPSPPENDLQSTMPVRGARLREFGDSGGTYEILIDRFPEMSGYIEAAPADANGYLDAEKIPEIEIILATFKFAK